MDISAIPPLFENRDNLLSIRYNRPQFAKIGSRKMRTSQYENLAITTEGLSLAAQNAFDFQYPGRLIFGQDSVNQLGELMLEHGGRRTSNQLHTPSRLLDEQKRNIIQDESKGIDRSGFPSHR